MPPGVIDFDRVAGFLVEKRAADRRGRGDEPLRRIGVFGHDELKHQLLAVALDDVERRSETGAIGRNAIDVDQRDLGDALLQHADPRLDQALPLFRRVVLRVLAQVAQLARALDLLRQLELQLAIERLDFVLEFLDQTIFHRVSRHGRLAESIPQCYPSGPCSAITSRQNAIVARFRAAARGDADDLLLLDGAHLVAEPRRRASFITCWWPPRRWTRPKIAPLVERADRARCRGGAVPRHRSWTRSARCDRRARSSRWPSGPSPQVTLFTATAPLVVVAVRRPGSGQPRRHRARRGGRRRHGVVAAGASADPFGWKALRGSMGSALRLPIATRRPRTTASDEARRHGCRIVATVPRGGRPLFEPT